MEEGKGEGEPKQNSFCEKSKLGSNKQRTGEEKKPNGGETDECKTFPKQAKGPKMG